MQVRIMKERFVIFEELGMCKMSFIQDIEQLLEKMDGTVSLALEGEVTYHYQSGLVHRPASLIKLPILATALLQAEQGRLICKNRFLALLLAK